MKSKKHCTVGLLICSVLLAAYGVAANPILTPGVWRSISPTQLTWSGIQGAGTSFTGGMAVDPTNPSTIYLTTSNFSYVIDGLYKSTNGGSNWARIGKITNPIYQGADSIIEEGIRVRIDPNNPQHLYCGDGVRGSSLGFWISQDGGDTFTMPDGFKNEATVLNVQNSGMLDVYDIAIDPADFNHVLVTFHSPWSWGGGPGVYDGNAGVLESKDGGITWIAHDPIAGWGEGHSIWFLKSSSTWLLGTQGDGFWRTTNSGTSWTQVSTTNIAHGGGEIYYTKAGMLYAACADGALRSSDNGVTWTRVGSSLPGISTNGIGGDGTLLYTHQCWGGDPDSWYVSAETDGMNWTKQTGAGDFSCGPFEMAHDAANGILYSANWATGLLALKLPSTGTAICVQADRASDCAAVKNHCRVLIGDRLVIAVNNHVEATGAAFYGINGRLIARSSAAVRSSSAP